MFRRLRQSSRSFARPVVTLASLLAFLVSIVGVPISPAARKDHSQPFPCQDRPCGCATAEQCRKSCCCFSDEQKREWARKHAIDNPAFVSMDDLPADENDLVPLACVEEKPSSSQLEAPRGGCCTQESQLASRKPSRSSAKKSSCCARSGRSNPVVKLSEEDTVQFVVGSLARHCQGMPSAWTMAGLAMLPEIRVSWSPDLRVVSMVSELHVELNSAEAPQPVPPPRLPA